MESTMTADRVAEERAQQGRARLQHAKIGQFALLLLCATALVSWLGLLGWGAGWLIKLW
jgi:hypothetical protein